MGMGDDDSLETSGHSSCAAADLSTVALDETGRAPYKILLSLLGIHFKGVYHLTLLTINVEGLMLILYSIF